MSKDTLAKAADSQYQSRPQGLFKTVQSWYKPVYDYKTEGLTPEQRARNPKYFNGRMRQWEFILLHVLVVFNTIALIMVPVAYFSLIPQYLQYRIDLIGTDGNAVNIHKVAVGKMDNTSIEFAGDFRVDALAPFPVYAGFRGFTINMVSDGNVLGQVDVPEVGFWLNKEVVFNISGTIRFDADNQKNTKALISKFSSGGINDLALKFQFAPTILTFGMPAYWHLPLHRNVDIGDVAGTAAGLLATAQYVGQNSKYVNFVAEPFDNYASLKAYFDNDMDKITQLPQTLGGLEFVWDKFSTNITDTTFSIGFAVASVNYSPFALELIDQIDYYLAVQGTKVMKMSLRRIGLNDNFNYLNFALDFTFIDPSLDTTATQAALESAFASFASSFNFNFALVGPVKISGAGFMENMTSDLQVTGSLNDIIAFLPQSIASAIKSAVTNPTSLLTPEVVQEAKDILMDSKISLEVLADKLEGIFGIKLGALAYIKPPQEVDFPYASTVSIYGNDVKAIQSDLSAISITRESDGMRISTNATVTPVNTDEAATGLAAAINPILAANPSVGTVGIKDFGFFTPGQPVFKWCSAIFGQRIIHLQIPGINKEALINLVASNSTGKIMSAMSNLISVGNVNLAQLTDKPGFGAKGNVKVAYPAGYPQLLIDIGYFNLATTVEDTSLMTVQLPTGLKFYPQSSGTDINGQAVIGRDAAISSKVQKFVNALTADDRTQNPSFAGVTGLSFGASPTQNFVTFSKVVVDVRTDTILNVVLPSSNSTDIVQTVVNMLPANLIKATGLDATVSSASNVALSANANVNNPFKVIEVSLGTTQLTALLGSQTLSGVSVSPLDIKGGNSSLTSNVALTVATGANGQAKNVADLVNAVLAKDTSSSLKAGVTGFTLLPPGVTSGPAVIDQFAGVIVNVATGKLISLGLEIYNYISSSQGKGPIDISALLPDTTDLNKLLTEFNPSIKSVQSATAENRVLNAGTSASYTNPLPLSAKLPYVAVDTSLNGVLLATVQMSKFELDRSSGTLSPSIVMKVNKADGLPQTVSTTVSDFLNGQLNTKIQVGGIYFGTPDSINDLFSAVSVTANPYVQSFVAPASQWINTQLQSVGATVNPLQKRDTSTLLTIQGPFGIVVTVNSIDLTFLPASQVKGSINLTLTLPIETDINFGFISITTGIDSVTAATVTTGFGFKGTNPTFDLAFTAAVNDVDDLANKVADIVSAFLKQLVIPGIGVGENALIGVSNADYIDAFSQVSIGLSVDKLAAPLKSMLNFNDILNQIAQNPDQVLAQGQSLAGKFGVTVNGLGIAAQPGRTMRASAVAGFSNTFPITISGLDYIGSAAGLDDTVITAVTLPEFNIGKGQQSFNLVANAQFPSSQAIKDKVKAFGDDITNNFGNTAENLVVSQIAFGVSQADHFKFMSKVVIPIPSKVLFNSNTLALATKLAKPLISGLDITKMVSNPSADVEFTQDKKILANLAAGLALPLSVGVDIPFSQFGADVNATPGFEIQVQNLKLDGNANATQKLNIATTTVVDDTLTLANNIAALTSALLHGNPLPGTIGGGRLSFGVSASDCVDSFSELAVGVKLSPNFDSLVNDAKDYAAGLNYTAILGKLGVKLGAINVAAKAGKTVSSTITAGFTNPFALTVKGLNYAATNAGIDALTVTTIKSSLSKTTNNNLNLEADLTFNSDPVVIDAVGSFSNDLSTSFGSTNQFLTASGATFGFSESTAFKFLSQSILGFNASILLNQKNLGYALQYIKESGLNTTTALGLVKPKALDIQFNPSNVINTGIQADLTVPYQISANMPYFSTDGFLNGLTLANLVVNGFSVTGQSTNTLNLASLVALFDSDEIETTIAHFVDAAIADYKNIPGNVGGGNLYFGLDSTPANVIDTFSKVKLSVDVKTITDIVLPLIPDLSNFDPIALLQSFNPSLQNLQAKTLPGKILGTSFTAGFNSSFPISVKGLGFMGAAAGVDPLPIMQLTASGFSVSPGVNSLQMTSQIFFPSAPQIPPAVGAFVNDVIKNFGNTQENFLATGIAFGFDAAHSFNLLKKTNIKIPTTLILNQKNLDLVMKYVGTIDPSVLLKSVSPSKAHISASQNGEIIADIAGSVSNVNLTAQAQIGYVETSALIDGNQLVGLKIPSGLNIATKDNAISLALVNNLLFSNDAKVKGSVNTLINGILNNATLTNTVGAGGFKFGSDNSAANIIDTFSQTAVSLSVSKFQGQINSLIQYVLATVQNIISGKSDPNGPFAKVAIDIQGVDIDVFDETTLDIKATAGITGLPFDFALDMPYVFTSVKYNDADFLNNTVLDTKFTNGAFSTHVLPSMPINRDAAQKVLTILGNILLHRHDQILDTITIEKLGFGFSSAVHVETFEEFSYKTAVTKPIASIVDYFDQKRPFELHNIQAQLNMDGVDVAVNFTVPALPLNMLASATAGVSYIDKNGKPSIQVCKVPITGIKLPIVNIILVPELIPDGTGQAFVQALPPLLTWNDFSGNAQLGYTSLTGSNGKVFDSLSQAWFEAPSLYLWSPLVINVVPTWPWDPSHWNDIVIPIEVKLAFLNNGPFHLDVGHLVININDKIANRALLTLETKDNLVIINNLEGGDRQSVAGPPTMGIFRALIPFADFNPINFINLITHLIQSPTNTFGVDISLYRNGQELPYFKPILNEIMASGVLAQLVPFIGVILKHVQLAVLGVNLNTLPVIGPLINSAEDWLGKFIGKITHHKRDTIGAGNSTVSGNATQSTNSSISSSAESAALAKNISVVPIAGSLSSGSTVFTSENLIIQEHQRYLDLTAEHLDDFTELITDRSLLRRFIKKHKDIPTVQDKVIEHFDWRINHNIAGLNYTTVGDLVLQYLTDGIFRFHKYDLIGRPVCYVLPKYFKKEKGIEGLKKTVVYALEILRRWTSAQDNFQDYESVPHLYEIFRNHYPQLVGQAIVLNYGWIHAGIWNFIRTLLSAEARSKLKFISTEQLVEFIPEENIPAYYGGSDTSYPVPPDICPIIQTYGGLLKGQRTDDQKNIRQQLEKNLHQIPHSPYILDGDYYYDAVAKPVKSAADLQSLLHTQSKFTGGGFGRTLSSSSLISGWIIEYQNDTN
ncbi:hypothetical protein HDV01_003434 [Terramyces sp. JEL0728]|nr:hypothetical protein HDV01_003434 [Terramyces sp. JEL0728]